MPTVTHVSLNLSGHEEENKNGPLPSSSFVSFSLFLSLSRPFFAGGCQPSERKTTMEGDQESRCSPTREGVYCEACAESATTKNSLCTGQRYRGASRPIYRLCNSECIADVKPPAHTYRTPLHADRIVRACVPACTYARAPRVDNSRATRESVSRVPAARLRPIPHAGSADGV